MWRLPPRGRRAPGRASNRDGRDRLAIVLARGAGRTARVTVRRVLVDHTGAGAGKEQRDGSHGVQHTGCGAALSMGGGVGIPAWGGMNLAIRGGKPQVAGGRSGQRMNGGGEAATAVGGDAFDRSRECR